MIEQWEECCMNCAYAVVRTNPEKFKWCKYECTYDFSPEESMRRIPYKYEHDTCPHFLKTMGMEKEQDDDTCRWGIR